MRDRLSPPRSSTSASRWSVTMQVIDSLENPAVEPRPATDAVPVRSSGSLFSAAAASTLAAADDEFDYRPVAILAPISLIVGVCSATGLMFPGGVLIGVAGILLASVSLWQIRTAQGELSGRWLGLAGLVVSTLFTVAGGGYHGYVYATEVPEGHERLSFSWLSKQGMVIEEGQNPRPTDEVAQFDGKKIYIKGYMYPVRQRHGLTEFVLCKDNGDCCFGGQPKLTDMITVKMQPGLTVDLLEQQLVGVAGTFRANTVTQSGELTSVYMIEGTHFR